MNGPTTDDDDAPISEVRPRTIGRRSLTDRILTAGAAEYPERPGVDYVRPATRADCADGVRPCPFVSCRFSLYLDVDTASGGIKLNFPDREPGDMVESCALDVADRGGLTLEEVGEVTNVTRERVRQIEAEAMAQVRPLLVGVAQDWNLDPTGTGDAGDPSLAVAPPAPVAAPTHRMGRRPQPAAAADVAAAPAILRALQAAYPGAPGIDDVSVAAIAALSRGQLAVLRWRMLGSADGATMSDEAIGAAVGFAASTVNGQMVQACKCLGIQRPRGPRSRPRLPMFTTALSPCRAATTETHTP